MESIGVCHPYNLFSTANIQPLFEIQKEKAGNICEKVNYKLPLRHETGTDK